MPKILISCIQFLQLMLSEEKLDVSGLCWFCHNCESLRTTVCNCV